MGSRRGIAAILAGAALCLTLAGIGLYGDYAILDRDAFADRAVSTLRSDEVREEIAARLARRVVETRPALSGDETAVEDAANRVVGGGDPSFAPAFRAAAARMHDALFSDVDADSSLRVAGSGAVLRGSLRRLPGWRSLPGIADPSLMAIDNVGIQRSLRAAATRARDLAVPLSIASGVAGLALLALGVAHAASRRRGIWAAGVTVAAAGGLLAAGVTGASDIVLDQFDTGFGDAVVAQIWDAFLGDLRLWALSAGAAGLVVAAAAGGPRLDPRALAAVPASRGGRALRALGLLAVAAVAVTLPEMLLHLGLVTLAALLVYVAAGELLRVLAPPESAARAARSVVAVAALLGLIAVATVAPG